MKKNNNLFSLDFNKKGNAALDGLTIIVVIFIFAICIVMGSYVLDENNTFIQNSTMANESKVQSANWNGKFINLFDNIFIFLFVLLLLTALISTFFLDTHPVYFIVTFIFLISLFVVSILLANVYDDIMLNPTFSVYAVQFVYTTWVLQNLVLISIITGFLLAITLYIKLKVFR